MSAVEGISGKINSSGSGLGGLSDLLAWEHQ
jgi:hypothetical protein